MTVQRFSSDAQLTPLERMTTKNDGKRMSPSIIDLETVNSVLGIRDIAEAEVAVKIVYPDGIEEANGFGSGFLIGGGLIVTNKHVLGEVTNSPKQILQKLKSDQVRIQVNLLNSDSGSSLIEAYETIPADLIAISSDSDLALLRINSNFERSLDISDSEPEASSDAYTVSNPYGVENQVVTWGQVLTLERSQELASEQLNEVDVSEVKDRLKEHDDENKLITDNSTDKGSSGSALLNSQGEVIGVVNQGVRAARAMGARIFRTDFDPANFQKNNGSFTSSIPNTVLIKFLQENGIDPENLSHGMVNGRDFKAIYSSGNGIAGFRSSSLGRIAYNLFRALRG